MLAAAAALALLVQTGAFEPARQPPPPPLDALATAAEEIVVTARPRELPPLLDPVGYYRQHCFEPSRLTGQPAPPEEDSDWMPLEEDIRRQFGAADPAIPAFALVDMKRGHTLLLKFEQFSDARNVHENRCTMVIIGGGDHEALVDDMAKLFRGPGTQRHVGKKDGVPEIIGWEQWVWTAIPSRGSERWQVQEARGAARGAGTWVVVTSPGFWSRSDYVLGDLKIKTEGPRAVSVLSFSHKTKKRESRTADR